MAGATVCVIDDDPGMRQTVVDILALAGIALRSVRAVIAAARRNRDLANGPVGLPAAAD
jgi:FixJ family two-component response regulator